MNSQIIENLYQIWSEIGALTNKISHTEKYTVVSMSGSDWPNRVFDLKNTADSITEIIKLSKDENLPEILTLSKPNDVGDNPELEFYFAQKNMALEVSNISNQLVVHPNIKRVETKSESVDFANVASGSFGYHVDFNVIEKLVFGSKNIQLFIYQEGNLNLGCGIVFFDTNNNAGLHMIGTLPEGRGKGIGKSMTERLLIEAKEHNSQNCVLHASLMGESIYRKLGFGSYGEIETFKIRRKGK